MRGVIGRRIPNSADISYASKQVLVPFSSSASSSGGHGRGRGRGSGLGSSSDSPHIDFTPSRPPGKPDEDLKNTESPGSPLVHGSGHGRGKAVPSSPTIPSFSSLISSVKSSSAGRGRATEEPRLFEGSASVHKKPVFDVRENAADSPTVTPPGVSEMREENSTLHQSLISVLSGAGRGKPMKQPGPDSQSKEENRHIRSRQDPGGRGAERGGRGSGTGLKMTREEAMNNAVRILSQGGSGSEESGTVGRGRGGFRGRGGRGRGSFRGRGAGGRGRVQDTEDGYAMGLYLGDNADGEKLAKRLGTDYMNQLVEGFEEMSSRVLPSPMEDEYLESVHTNFMIECEPEYLVGDFESNPDIDEKPPIPLREALEKMKPFLMAYERIENEAEWEEIIKETMERAPLLKEIVDYYSGPDRVTAKQQQEELERVEKTLPEHAHSSVKQFTNRAVLSLQSNPGWGFDKKCQFMDKLVRDVSQHYK